MFTLHTAKAEAYIYDSPPKNYEYKLQVEENLC